VSSGALFDVFPALLFEHQKSRDQTCYKKNDPPRVIFLFIPPIAGEALGHKLAFHQVPLPSPHQVVAFERIMDGTYASIGMSASFGERAH
jgi:hypothetical protein